MLRRTVRPGQRAVYALPVDAGCATRVDAAGTEVGTVTVADWGRVRRATVGLASDSACG